MWLHSERLQRQGGGLGERLAVRLLSGLHHFMLAAHKDKAVVKLLRQIRKERRCLITGFEAFNIYSITRAQNSLPGDIAEVGVYAGASSKLICEARRNKTVHLFDTFLGLPESSEKDRNVYRGKKHPQYACSLESVKEYLKDYENVNFYQGLFPDTAGPIENCKFCFAHFDVDLYESTRACIEFFYPRMTAGGIMLSHDYSILAGVKAAFTEFFADKPEDVLELPTTQCMVVKR
jgi:hypothetical protein